MQQRLREIGSGLVTVNCSVKINNILKDRINCDHLKVRHMFKDFWNVDEYEIKSDEVMSID